MKKKLKIAAIALFAILGACTNENEKEVSQVAKNYLDAVANYHFDDAIPYSSSKTKEITLPLFNELLTRVDSNKVNANRPAVITIHRTKILTDTTARVYYHKSTPIKEVDDSVNVVRENNVWLVEVIAANILAPKKAEIDYSYGKEQLQHVAKTMAEKNKKEE